MCSSAISNYDDDDQSTSEYNGSSTLTPSTTQNDLNSNATTISSQTSLDNCRTTAFHQSTSSGLNNCNNNNTINNNDYVARSYHHKCGETLSHQQSANYYGVNDLKEASWRKQANAIDAIKCDFYGGDAKLSQRDQQYQENHAINGRCGSETNVNNMARVRQQTIQSRNNASHASRNNHHAPETRALSSNIKNCGDSLDDVSGVFDQMSIQSELVASTLARYHYDQQENHKFQESLSAKESFRPSHVIPSYHQPTTTLPKPSRFRHSVHLTRTYSMIGKSRRGRTDPDGSMTLNRHERRFMTQNIASVLSKPRAPPVVPSIPQIGSMQTHLASSPLTHQENNARDRFVTHSLHDFHPNTSYDDYTDAQDTSFSSRPSQPLSADNFSSDDSDCKKKNNGALSSLSSKITLATKGKAMQNQIASLKRFFSSIPKPKSFMTSKKSSLFDIPDGNIFRDTQCPTSETLPTDHVKSSTCKSVEKDLFSASCNGKRDYKIDDSSHNPPPSALKSLDCSDIQDRISTHSNAAYRLNYIKELHRQSSEFASNQNNRKSWTPDTGSMVERKPGFNFGFDNAMMNNHDTGNAETCYGGSSSNVYGSSISGSFFRATTPKGDATHGLSDTIKGSCDLAPLVPSSISSSTFMKNSSVDSRVTASTASLSSATTVDMPISLKNSKDRAINMQHTAIVAPRSSSCTSKLSSIYAPTILSLAMLNSPATRSDECSDLTKNETIKKKVPIPPPQNSERETYRPFQLIKSQCVGKIDPKNEAAGRMHQGKTISDEIRCTQKGHTDYYGSISNQNAQDIDKPINLSMGRCNEPLCDGSITRKTNSSLSFYSASSVQQRMTLPPPPPPPLRIYNSSHQDTVETNLDAYVDNSAPLPPPPSDLKGLSFSNLSEGLGSSKMYKHESYMPTPALGSDGECDEEESGSWQMASLPVFHERKLTTLFEEQPRKYQKTQAMNIIPPAFQNNLTSISKNNTSVGRSPFNFDSNSEQASFQNLINVNTKVTSDKAVENSVPVKENGDLNVSDDLDADTTLVSEPVNSSYERKDYQKLVKQVNELELKLQSKEKSFTDLQLEQLSTAYLIDQLKTTIEKLEKENSHLKATLNRYHQLQGVVRAGDPLKINHG